MRALRIAVVAVTLAAWPAFAQAPKVGILPFDVVSIDGASAATGASLAKLVRIEMIKARKVTPDLLTLPANTKMPIEPEQAAAIGTTAGDALVIVGTVTAADVTQSSQSVNTGSLLSGVGVGGQLQRQNATIGLHVEIVDPATGKILDTFEVEGKNSSTGIGMDLSTTLGSLDKDPGSLDRSPMGKALQDAAKKVNDEVAKRAAKIKR